MYFGSRRLCGGFYTEDILPMYRIFSVSIYRRERNRKWGGRKECGTPPHLTTLPSHLMQWCHMGWRSVAHDHRNGAREAILECFSLFQDMSLKGAKNEHFGDPQNWSKIASLTPTPQKWVRNWEIASVEPLLSSTSHELYLAIQKHTHSLKRFGLWGGVLWLFAPPRLVSSKERKTYKMQSKT